MKTSIYITLQLSVVTLILPIPMQSSASFQPRENRELFSRIELESRIENFFWQSSVSRNTGPIWTYIISLIFTMTFTTLFITVTKMRRFVLSLVLRNECYIYMEARGTRVIRSVYWCWRESELIYRAYSLPSFLLFKSSNALKWSNHHSFIRRIHLL